MGVIHSCSCGAKIRLPDQAAGRTFRCPKCKVEIEVVPAYTGAFAAARPEPAEELPPPGPPTGATCPICQSDILGGEVTTRCPRCRQVHHRECWEEVGGCSTYGCEEAPAAPKEGPQRPLTAWGDTKRCPACGEQIKAVALRCLYCRTEFDTADPLTARDLRRKARKAEEFRSLRATVIVLFCLALSGLLAPVALILSLFLVLPQRENLARAGPFYQVLGYSGLGLSVLYSVLMVYFLVG